ncbi:MAG TPA: alpha-galactosidase [Tepidisphaeraceae bacterium]|jgi:alpha-galactosidase|nr:alpha-galactosidase [Tepidisphaeraceae bacterium]
MIFLSLLLAAATTTPPPNPWLSAAFGASPQSIPAPAVYWPAATIPFSFTYDGKPSSELLPKWTRHTEGAKTIWLDPDTKLQVTAEPRSFDDFGAVEWLLRFQNTGTQDSPLLENVQALDVSLPASADHDPILDQINGDDASPNSFAPTSRAISAGQSIPLAPVGGRPSNGTFPFFALQNNSDYLFVAIGWTGQWAANLSRDSKSLHLTAGMQLTHLHLHPDESIRTPRILLMPAHGNHDDAHNKFRQLLLAHYVPRVNGELPKFAVAAQEFNSVFGMGIRPEWATEAGQIAAAKIEKQIGCDTHWFDAGWFEGNFPNGVGNWIVKPKEFPRGLGPIGEACHRLGLRFLVWYEPERVAANTQIVREHPEFLFPPDRRAQSALFNLGNPVARRWMTHLILSQMDAGKIDQYRNDFNIDPLPFWRAADSPNRQGIAEIRYVEGLYQMWDAIRAARPDLIPDDCASGGRRIDLEMVMRSIVQTRSDAAVAPGRSDWHQCESYGLSEFLPLHATIAWETSAYAARSAGAAGICMEWDILDPKFPLTQARADIEEIKSNQKYWQGNFYPLTPYSFDTNVWLAWQLDRPDLHEGIALIFRRGTCPYSAMQIPFRALDPNAAYHVELVNDEHQIQTRTMTGRDLIGLDLRLPHPESSMLIRYRLEKGK